MLENIIKAQTQAHPSSKPADLIKLCFQAAFGAEHLLSDRERARTYLIREYEATLTSDEPLFEEISSSYARVNIGAVKRLSIDPELLFEAFYLTASEGSSDGRSFDAALTAVGKLAREDALPFSYDEWSSALKEYFEMGGGPVHHSPEYREAESPAYRVIAKKYITLLKENENEQDRAF